MEPIEMVMRNRRLEWFRRVKRRSETENIRAVTCRNEDGGEAPVWKTQFEMYNPDKYTYNSTVTIPVLDKATSNDTNLLYLTSVLA